MQHDVIYVTHDDLPGRVRGLTRWSDRTIWVRASLSQVERRALLDALRWSRHPAVAVRVLRERRRRASKQRSVRLG